MDDAASARKEQFELNRQAFDGLLEWIDAERDRAALEYERIRKELLGYFSRYGARTVAEDLVDLTIDRVAKLVESPLFERADAADRQYRDKLPYFKKTARYIYLEYLNSSSIKKTVDLSEEELREAVRRAEPRSFDEWKNETREKIKLEYEHDCLEQCEQLLTPTNRRLIKLYFQGASETKKELEGEGERTIDKRKTLAEQLNVSLNTLRVRIHRIRGMIEECVVDCVERKLADEVHPD
ncbi:MAG TPA: hypothetical protein VF553_01280 [Pyrinomonadaceae bacterium]|jgi:hypothetical protein